MKSLRIAWDEAKNLENQRKHRVSFEAAKTVFVDEHALFLDDPDHSDEEQRFVPLGLSSTLRLLVVCHCYREAEDVIRIISARKAVGAERRRYEERWRR